MLCLGADKFKIELLEMCPGECIEELRAKEGGWIRQIGTLNEQIAGRDQREWYDDHREQQIEEVNTYRENTKIQ